MTLVTMDESAEVEVDLASMTLEQLAKRANAEHFEVVGGLYRALNHALAAGAILTEAHARVDFGEWGPWLDRNCPQISRPTAGTYLRIYHYRSEVQAAGAISVEKARALLVGRPAIPEGHTRVPKALVDSVRSASEDGRSIREIALHFGIDRETVKRAIDPEYAAKSAATKARKRRERTAAQRALAEKEAREERDRLARERGGNLGKAYDQVRKLMPTIDAAVTEGLSVEARALAVRLEDEIFKALKR